MLNLYNEIPKLLFWKVTFIESISDTSSDQKTNATIRNNTIKFHAHTENHEMRILAIRKDKTTRRKTWHETKGNRPSIQDINKFDGSIVNFQKFCEKTPSTMRWRWVKGLVYRNSEFNALFAIFPTLFRRREHATQIIRVLFDENRQNERSTCPEFPPTQIKRRVRHLCNFYASPIKKVCIYYSETVIVRELYLH